MEFYIGQIFEDIYPSEAADWCNGNNAMIVEIDPVVRTMTEEYETVEEGTKVIPAVTHIETDEDGNEYEVIDEPEHEETIYNPVVKTREIEKELRRFEIVAIPEPTIEEQNEIIKQRRANLYAELIDPLHAQKQRKTVLGTWTETDEAEYVAEVKRQTLIIQTDNPYVDNPV